MHAACFVPRSYGINISFDLILSISCVLATQVPDTLNMTARRGPMDAEWNALLAADTKNQVGQSVVGHDGDSDGDDGDGDDDDDDDDDDGDDDGYHDGDSAFVLLCSALLLHVGWHHRVVVSGGACVPSRVHEPALRWYPLKLP